MALPFYNWSHTAASNATADATVNWQEGMAPSAVNDSARAMMASTAAYRDDIAGAIATGGTSTAYTVSSFQVFDTLAHLSGQLIAFTPHTTNGATVTLNVDGLGAKPLRSAPSVELPAGTIVQGTPYAALYNASDAAFYLHGFFNNPYTIPIGASVDFWGQTAPNSSFVLAYGQAISRTTYSSLFSLLSTSYGTGDGSTTFNVPDLRGRVIAGKDDMGGSAASRLSGTTITAGGGATTLGGTGGAENIALSVAQIPTLTSTASPSLSVSVTSTNWVAQNSNDSTQQSVAAGGVGFTVEAGGGATVAKIPSTGTATGTVSSTSSGTSGNAHINVQPTIVANKLLRII